MKNLFTHIISDTISWPELKEKLSSYNTSNEKDGCKCTTAGSLFEYFAKYYFQIEPTVKDDYKEVWLYDEIPLDVKRVLNIGDIEHGVDLLLMDLEGNYIPVQCKFKNDETQKLSWSKDKISNLFAFIPNAKRYIVFSNASDIDDVSRSRYQGFNFFSIQNLLEISVQTFSNIHLSILSDQLKTENNRFSPKPFQQDAINAAKEHFKNYNRGQLILPCGAGKTLTALWIKESLNSTKVLVLVPSLALLRQIKNQWAAQRNHSFRYLCVCSEISIDNASDGMVTHTYDLDCSVTTESSIIRDFVTNSSPFVIYSTYQSLKAISDAISGLDFVFDLAICDEAHRTAGVDKSLFGLIHDNTLIPTAFRLYMTATPRVFSTTIKRNLETENTFLFDMSDSNIFGTEFYRMSFKKAIEGGILVDYKIISIGVSSSDVKKYIDNRYFLETGHTADTIANIVALEKVIHKYNATHAISFHSRIKYAESFSKIGAKLWTNISTDFISGEMTTGTRSILLDNFKKKPVAVLSNARCLTEGVDLPSIDLVYFCDPKNSKIDIVQASGRALRTDKEKPNKIGLIVVPIYHTDNDNLEEAVDKSCFKNLIQVIRSLSDQDERLQDEINCLAFSKGKKSSDSLHFEYIDTNIEEQSILVFNNFAEQLKSHIFTQVIEKTCSNWDLCLLELKEWIDKYGDYPNKDTNRFLSAWVSSQRIFKREGKLSIDRLNKLEEMGFVWDYQEFIWEMKIKQLEIWRKENQNLWPSYKRPKSATEKILAAWMFKIGSDYKSNKLNEKRLQQLHDIGYLFEDRIWRKKYDKLCEYLARGNGFPKNPQDTLYRFCMDQINKFNQKSLSKIQIQLLENIGFFKNIGEFTPSTLEEAILSLCRYKTENGKMPPQQYALGKNGTYKFISLSNCIRSAYSENRLSKQSIEDLDRIGFVFNSELKRNEEWNSTFNILREFRIKYPDRWPNQTIDDEKKLSAWCLHQRQWYNGKKKKYGPYPQERKDKLDSIGFMWELGNKWGHDDDSASWEECFSKYLDFCRDNPNSILPYLVNGDRNNLCTWYHNQRSLYRKNKLPIDKVQKLQEAGILDNLDKASDMSIWNARLGEYIAFRQNNGTSEIPYKVNGKNNPLSAWFHRQRYLFRNNKLSDAKLSKLREAGVLENV